MELMSGTKVENQTVPPDLTGVVIGPVEGLTGAYYVEWSDGRTEIEWVSDVTVIDQTVR